MAIATLYPTKETPALERLQAVLDQLKPSTVSWSREQIEDALSELRGEPEQ